MRDSAQLTDRAIQQIRRRSLDLRPALLDDLGLIPAMKQCIARHRERGDIRIRSQPGEGCEVLAWLPLSEYRQ